MSDGPRQPDPHKATQITVVGKKGEGKTELAWLLFDSYPYDRVLIDPNGDIKTGEDTEDLDAPIPGRWPAEPTDLARERDKRKRRTFRFMPDFSSPGYLEDIDRAVALAYNHARTMVFLDEAHEAAPAGRTPPHVRRALRQGRHRLLSTIYATPRPMTVDPVVLSNSDWVYVFKLPNPHDRRRVAETIGWDPKDFDEGVHALGKHEYLRYDAGADELKHFPPLPGGVIAHHRS